MLRIGWASVDMTPDRPVLLAGQHYTRVSTHVNDPLTVTALAIESDDGSEQALMLSADLVSFSLDVQERVRQRVRQDLPDLDSRKLFINAIHTHTSLTLAEGVYDLPDEVDVMTPTECLELFVEKAAEAAVEAWRNRTPGGVSRAFGHAVVGHNRRASYFDGTSKMYGKTDVEAFEHVEGYEDHSLDVLFTWEADRKLTGMVVNLACPSQVTENAMYVSADFWHEVRQVLRERHGSGLFVLGQCAAAGDQSPHFILYGPQEAFMRERSGLTEREEIARRIANGVDEVIDGASKDIQNALRFKHVVEDLNLPARRITEEEYESAKAERKQFQGEMDSGKPGKATYRLLDRAKSVIARYEAQEKSPVFTMELHVLRLGEVAIATNPFELFLDYGLRIKARSKAPQTFIVQLAAGKGAYLPTRRAIAAKSYGAGAADNRVGPEGGQVLVNRTLEIINDLWTD